MEYAPDPNPWPLSKLQKILFLKVNVEYKQCLALYPVTWYVYKRDFSKRPLFTETGLDTWL